MVLQKVKTHKPRRAKSKQDCFQSVPLFLFSDYNFPVNALSLDVSWAKCTENRTTIMPQESFQRWPMKQTHVFLTNCSRSTRVEPPPPADSNGVLNLSAGNRASASRNTHHIECRDSNRSALATGHLSSSNLVAPVCGQSHQPNNACMHVSHRTAGGLGLGTVTVPALETELGSAESPALRCSSSRAHLL